MSMSTIKKTGLFVAGCLIFVLTACNGNSSVAGYNTSNPTDTTLYGRHVQVIFNQTCGSSYGGCHINGSAYGVNLATYSNVMASYSSEYGRKVVIPGNAAESPMVNKIESNPLYGYRMPYGRSPLSTAQIDTIINWINRGAKHQ